MSSTAIILGCILAALLIVVGNSIVLYFMLKSVVAHIDHNMRAVVNHLIFQVRDRR